MLAYGIRPCTVEEEMAHVIDLLQNHAPARTLDVGRILDCVFQDDIKCGSENDHVGR